MEGRDEIRGGRFPATRHSIVRAIQSADAVERQRGLDELVDAYWKPVYKYLRIRWRLENADAEDLTQSFFVTAIEKEFFARYDPSRARFRTFVRVCLDRFTANEQKAKDRLKRGGATLHVSLDFQGAEGELGHLDIPDEFDPDAFFEREWARSFFEGVVERLRREYESQGKDAVFEVFRRYDLSETKPPSNSPEIGAAKVTYQELSTLLGIPVTQVTNYLFAARRRFRALVLERLREVTASDSEFRDEARSLLGIDPAEGE